MKTFPGSALLERSIMGKGEILLYQSEDQSTQIEVRVADGTIWLSQKQIAGLFGCSMDNVGWHLKNIYKEEELKEEATSEVSSEVHQEGNRWVRRKVVIYNLDAAISVG
ncbi:MAG: hypothetical protein NTV01_21055 [Bacteroidia bacterium]|nr:hypothetical protein [Bacteroidia bacterium]